MSGQRARRDPILECPQAPSRRVHCGEHNEPPLFLMLLYPLSFWYTIAATCVPAIFLYDVAMTQHPSQQSSWTFFFSGPDPASVFPPEERTENPWTFPIELVESRPL